MSGLDLGLVGNGAVSALLNRRGDIVWMCNPCFDGDPVLCSLLSGDPDDPSLDGSFRIALEGHERWRGKQGG